MKKILSSLLVLAGLTAGSAAFAQNIATVDVQAVVLSSSQVKALQKEQQVKMQELGKWLKTAQEDVNKQQTKENKEKLVKKYDQDFAKKRAEIIKNYQVKMQAIDKSITSVIEAQAKAKGYDMIINKGMVIYGGDDITADVIKAVK